MSTLNDLTLAAQNPNTDWRQFGDIVARYSQDHGLVILNYTNAAQYANRWNKYERICRGLIINTQTGDTVARPMDKFFNWGQDVPSPKSHLVEVTEKLDGSLGLLYRNNNHFHVATRGSFDSDQALWATDFLQRKYDLTDLPDRLTLLFEIIYPKNRVVIDYGDREDLVLVGVRDRRTGGDWFMSRIVDLARQYKFTTPLSYDVTNPEHFVQVAKSLSANREGFVLRFSDGKRFKIKGDAYLDMHKLIFGLSFKRVLEAYQAGQAREYIALLPAEFVETVEGWRQEIETTVQTVQTRVMAEYELCPKSSRKEFALHVLSTYPDDAPYLFSYHDGKDITPIILKREFENRGEQNEHLNPL